MGIAYTTNIKNYWAISDRIYVNQAVPSEEEYIDNRDCKSYEKEDIQMENKQLTDLMNYYGEMIPHYAKYFE